MGEKLLFADVPKPQSKAFGRSALPNSHTINATVTGDFLENKPFVLLNFVQIVVKCNNTHID